MDTGGLERFIARREQRMSQAAGRGRFRSGDWRRDQTLQSPGPTRRGLNENFARELLELHTLGVDGGYTQRDIIEVARCFTGWTLLPPQAGQHFVYVPELHDKGKKFVLGSTIKGKGESEGEAVLDLLARHPSTARHVATKLARRFVSDFPPESLVDGLAATFLDTDGDIRQVMGTLFASREFWSREAAGAKVKTPLELAASALRATGAEIAPLPSRSDPALAAAMEGDGSMMTRSALRAQIPGLQRMLREMGQPLYRAQPPTGYPDSAEEWVSTGALLSRMKFTLALAADRVPGVSVDLPSETGGALSIEEALPALGLRLYGRPPAPETRAAVLDQLRLGPTELSELGIPRLFGLSRELRVRLTVGWLLAAPEFQRR
jgi:hypothetical protein